MAGKQNIKLRICGKDYPFGIDPEKEELYRIAARRVNEMVTQCAQRSIEDYTVKDFLALTALNFALDGIVRDQSLEVGSEDVKELGRLSDKITDFMNRLTDGQ